MRRAFKTLLVSSGTPYGYTLTIWSSGAVLRHFRGLPSLREIFLFLAGALFAFTALSLVGFAVARRAKPFEVSSALDWTGVLHWFAAGLAVGAVALLAQIPSWVAWPLGAFVATAVFLCVATLQLALVGERMR
jgi:hypothetical protein